MIQEIARTDYYFWLKDLSFADLCKLRKVAKIFATRIPWHIDNHKYSLTKEDKAFIQLQSSKPKFKKSLKEQPYALFARMSHALAQSNVLRELAQEGHPCALYALCNRAITPQQVKNPKDYLMRAAAAGDPKANLFLGNEYFSGVYISMDFAQAGAHYTVAATHNYNALAALAQLYDKIHARALAEFALRNGAEEGNLACQRNLGKRLADKDETLVEAKKWLTNAAQQNDRLAIDVLSDMLAAERHVVEALFWKLKAFDPTDSKEQYKHGLFLHRLGFKMAGTKWIKSAAHLDDVDAQYRLGRCYLDGEGCEKNPRRAWYWLSLATAYGHPDAKALAESLQTQPLRTK